MRRALLLASLVLLFSFALGVTPVYGQTFDITLDPIEVTIQLDEDGSSQVNVECRLNNFGLSDIDSISFRVDSLDVSVVGAVAGEMPALATAIRMDRYTEILIELPFSLEVNSSTWLLLEFVSYDLQTLTDFGLASSHSYADFSFYIRPSLTFGNFTFTVVLPADATLSDESVVPLYPASSFNYTDGRSMAFGWYTQLLQPGQERVFIVKYQVPNTESQIFMTSPFFLALYILLGVAGGIMIAILGPKLQIRIRQLGQVKFVGITSEEQEVIDVLREKGGSCPQKELYTEFSMSQSKVSLILTALEERGLVRRFRDGRENVVHLIEET